MFDDDDLARRRRSLYLYRKREGLIRRSLAPACRGVYYRRHVERAVAQQTGGRLGEMGKLIMGEKDNAVHEVRVQWMRGHRSPSATGGRTRDGIDTLRQRQDLPAQSRFTVQRTWPAMKQ